MRRSLFLHSVIIVLVGQLTAAERVTLGVAIPAAYQTAGISSDTRSWSGSAPLLADLATTLAASEDPAAVALGCGCWEPTCSAPIVLPRAAGQAAPQIGVDLAAFIYDC